MKYLKPKDIEDINRFASTSPLAKMLKNLKTWNFSVGDVIVRYTVDSRGNKNLDLVSTRCPVPKKFRVLHIDDLGVPWVKQLSVSGGLGNKLYCLMNYIHNFQWEVDPEQIDSIILGHQYDPRAEYKRMRNSNPDYGSDANENE